MLQLERFKPYSSYDKPVKAIANRKSLINWSSIIDKLIRLAAKNTEMYASDVVISINCIEKQIGEPDFTEGTWLFGFRRDGVDHKEWVLNKHEDELKEYRTIWKLDFLQDETISDYYYFKLYEVYYSYL